MLAASRVMRLGMTDELFGIDAEAPSLARDVVGYGGRCFERGARCPVRGSLKV